MILVTGGTGFIGQALVRQLVEMGKPVRILLRPSRTSPQLPQGVSIEVAVSSLKDERGLRSAMKDVDVVFHLAGSERLSSRADLQGVDINGTKMITEAAQQAGVKQIIFLSHLGADRVSAFPVLKAKALAEYAITHSALQYTILRSAVVFGPGDQFTVSLARLLRMSPGFFLSPGDGSVLLQPLWVEDLVTCLIWALDDPSMVNQTISIGGGELLTYRETVEIICSELGIHRPLINMTPAYLRKIALWVEHLNPRFPVSIFWLDYLSADRTCDLDVLPRRFGIMPARLEHHVQYLQDEVRRKPRIR